MAVLASGLSDQVGHICGCQAVGRARQTIQRFIDHFDGRTLNPGHANEGAWFIVHEK